MSAFGTRELKEVVTRIVDNASKNGTIDNLTPRMIRKFAEEQLGLEAGTLDEHKSIVKQAASEAMDALEENEDRELAQEPEKKKPTKESQPAKKADKVAKRKPSKPMESDTPPSKKAKVSTKPQIKTDAPKQTVSKGKTVRSASMIPSSDEDDGHEKKAPLKSPPKPKRPSLPKNASAHDADVSTADVDDPPTHNEDVTAHVTAQRKTPKSKLSLSMTAEDVGDRDEAAQVNAEEESESEMSVLIDEPPKKKADRKKKDKAAAPQTKKKRTAKEPVEESPDDQEIKRLKSFVVGCGVRKVWSKEFKDIAEDKRAQIRRLKEILSGLGMTGRLSMEKAKAIKEKREFAQELEDVQTFEKAVVSGATRSRRKAAEAPESSGGNESDVEDLPPNTKKRPSARQSIMTFLGDQSDSE